MIPGGRGVRVVGDVHGDARAFAIAADTDLFVVQLGDLTDYGPDSAGALRIALRLLDTGRGLFLLGNHDLKLARVLAGRDVRIGPELADTLRQLDAGLRERAAAAIARAPGWLRWGEALFVHGGFHTAHAGKRSAAGAGGAGARSARAGAVRGADRARAAGRLP